MRRLLDRNEMKSLRFQLGVTLASENEFRRQRCETFRADLRTNETTSTGFARP